MNFVSAAQEILANYSKEELCSYNKIILLDKICLSSMGHNDVEGYQIFTPEFIVKDMCNAIGEDILDFSKNILEPTSGDGAFTVYILLRRFRLEVFCVLQYSFLQEP